MITATLGRQRSAGCGSDEREARLGLVDPEADNDDRVIGERAEHAASLLR